MKFTCVRPTIGWRAAEIVTNEWFHLNLQIRWPKLFRLFHFRMEHSPNIVESFRFHEHRPFYCPDGRIWEMRRQFFSPNRLLLILNASQRKKFNESWYEGNYLGKIYFEPGCSKLFSMVSSVEWMKWKWFFVVFIESTIICRHGDESARL